MTNLINFIVILSVVIQLISPALIDNRPAPFEKSREVQYGNEVLADDTLTTVTPGDVVVTETPYVYLEEEWTATPNGAFDPGPTATPGPGDARTDTPEPTPTGSPEAPTETPTLPADTPMTPTPTLSPTITETVTGTPTAEIPQPEDPNRVCKDECEIDQNGGEMEGLNQKVRIIFPEGALPEKARIKVNQVEDWEKLPYSLSGHPVELTAEKMDGQEQYHNFNEKVQIEISYDENELNGDETTLTLFYFDEANQYWTPIETRVDPEADILTGWTDHFSVFDYDVQNWQAHMPNTIQGFQVSSFTGAAAYEFPIELPPGPAGLKPSVSLSYNSQTIDGASSSSQASLAGAGWNLNAGGYIQRNMRKDSQHFVGDDTFTMVVGGVSHLLLPVPENDGGDGDPATQDFHTADESYWRISKTVTYNNSSGYLTEVSSWVVWDKTGNRYEFSLKGHYLSCESTHTYRPWIWMLDRIYNQSNQFI